jgi:hypothetical protein
MVRRRTLLVAALLAGVAIAQPPAAEKLTGPVDGIRDNSFLVEEAYNQEAGVVQHIWTARFGAEYDNKPNARTWDLSFTQEWPIFGQTHQFSYTVPYSFVDDDGEHGSGIGDFLINYRLQLLNDESRTPAFAPRASLIFPSGDEDRGFGTGEVGYQLNLPLSKTLSDRVYVNFNAGVTYTPNTRLKLSGDRRSEELDLLAFNLGASVIYAVTDTFHLLLEAVWDSSQALEEKQHRNQRWPYADRDQSDEVIISPGIRWAWNLEGDLQIVPGIALPIGLSEDAVDYGVFFYLSVEHPFTQARPGG